MSLPAWGAWIEIMLCWGNLAEAKRSLPAWGAWIEILSISNERTPPFAGRSPYGERGLKCRRRALSHLSSRSLPVWGAWIENRYPRRITWMHEGCRRRSPYGERGLKFLYDLVGLTRPIQSLPAWGAWIEIISSLSEWSKGNSRFPHRECGLKY